MAVNCNAPQAAESNATSLAVAKVCDPDANTVWTYFEPNELSDFVANLTKEQRDPISQNRGGGKPGVTALEASIGFSHDLTADFIDYFMDDFLFSTWIGNSAEKFVVTEVTASGFTIETGTALLEGAIVHTRNFDDAANNGRFVVGAGSTTTNIAVTGLTADASPATDAQLHYVGFEYPEGDIEIDADGNIASTATDFTTIGYELDQWIDVRGFTSQTGSTLARITGISANLLTLSNSELVTEVGTAKTVSIYESQLVKTVSVTDPLFRQPETTLELTYASATPAYEYGRKAQANQFTINLPLGAKSTADVTMTAADVETPVTTRKLGTWVNTVNNALMKPAASSRRVAVDKLDESGLTTYLKDITITINNNGGTEAKWGDLNSTWNTYGNQTVGSATEAVFTDPSVLAAARDNDTIQLSLSMFNEDATVVFHQPRATWDEPGKNFERNQKVKISGTINSFTDPTSYRFSCSLFWWVPAVA